VRLAGFEPATYGLEDIQWFQHNRFINHIKSRTLSAPNFYSIKGVYIRTARSWQRMIVCVRSQRVDDIPLTISLGVEGFRMFEQWLARRIPGTQGIEILET
jgi:hypothetical protein